HRHRRCRADGAAHGFRDATLDASERADLTSGEVAPRAGSKAAELERTETHASKSQNTEPDRGTHAAHLPLPAGVQNNAQRPATRAAGHRHPRGARDAFFERNAAPERGDRGGWHGTDDTHLVLALVPVSRMQHPLRPRAVVREQHEALGVLVEPTNRVKALARA